MIGAHLRRIEALVAVALWREVVLFIKNILMMVVFFVWKWNKNFIFYFLKRRLESSEPQWRWHCSRELVPLLYFDLFAQIFR